VQTGFEVPFHPAASAAVLKSTFVVSDAIENRKEGTPPVRNKLGAANIMRTPVLRYRTS
jgi:hypothetical protein